MVGATGFEIVARTSLLAGAQDRSSCVEMYVDKESLWERIHAILFLCGSYLGPLIEFDR